MKQIHYIFLVLFMAVTTVSCQPENNASHQHEDGHAHDEHNENPDEVKLLPEQMEVMEIQLGGFKSLNLSTTIKANGQLELPPQNKASLSAIFGGRVKNIMIREGEPVKKGQVIATLENPDFIKMQRNYIAAKEEYDFLKKEFERKKTLLKDKIVAQKSFQEVEANYKKALVAVNASKAELKLIDLNVDQIDAGNIQSFIPVKSPIEGFVRLVEINIGKFVVPQQEMFEIVDNDHIHIDLMVYEKDIDKIKLDQKVSFSLSTHPEKVFEGNVFAIGKAFEDDPKAVKVHAEITSKPEGLLPGMFVDARIEVKDSKVMALPDGAIVSEEGLDYIFVQIEDKHQHNHGKEHEGHHHDHGDEKHLKFRKIEVNKGASDIGFTEVVPVTKISSQSKVVIKGAYYLLAEMKKGEGGHGHAH